MTAAAKSTLLFVGVDGGGTGCRARIENAEGALLGSGIAGPAALRIGVDRAFAEVEKAYCAAAEDAGLGAGALASMLRRWRSKPSRLRKRSERRTSME